LGLFVFEEGAGDNLKKKIWVFEKEHIKQLGEIINKCQIEKQAALNAGENYRAWEIKNRISDVKELRSLALNTLRLLS
jgi:hypothetical protein